MMNPAFTTLEQMSRPLASFACPRNQLMSLSATKVSSVLPAATTSSWASACEVSAQTGSAAAARTRIRIEALQVELRMAGSSFGREPTTPGRGGVKQAARPRHPVPVRLRVLVSKRRLLFGFIVLLAACSKVSTPPATAAGSSALKRIDPKALQGAVEATARELLVPGAEVLLRTPQGDFQMSYGTTQIGRATLPRADTHFRIASNTKTMTAAVIIQMAQEGKLELGNPVSKYVPGVPDGEHITLAELLEMRSGLYNYLRCPELAASTDAIRPGLDAAGIAGDRLRAPAQLPAGDGLRVQQHELRAARPRRGARRWQAAGPGDAGSTVRAAGPEADGAPRQQREHDSRTLSRMATLYGSSSVAFTGTPPSAPALQAAARAGTLLAPTTTPI